VRLPLSDGDHELRVQMDWAKSPVLAVRSIDGDDVHVDVAMPSAFLGTIGVLLWPGRVFGLRLKEG
jgi:hypothetical protein